MFDWKAKIEEFKKRPSLSNTTHCVSVQQSNESGVVARVIGAYMLTPQENQQMHHVFIAVLDENGNVVRPGVQMKWGWAGQQPNEPSPPFYLDKGEGEPPGHIELYADQEYIWLEVLSVNGKPVGSDRILGMTGWMMPGEPPEHSDADFRHRSWLVVFQLGDDYLPSEPVIPDETPVVVPEDNTYKAYVIEQAALTARAVITALDRLQETILDDIVGPLEGLE